MLPLDLAKTAILFHLLEKRTAQTDEQLIPVVNAYANNNPLAAMEPARRGLQTSGHLTSKTIDGRQGFFSTFETGYVLTEKGEDLAVTLQGKDPQALRAAAALNILGRVAEQGRLFHGSYTEGVGPATTSAVFEQLVREGALSESYSLSRGTVCCLTEVGRQRLQQAAKSAKPAA